MSRFSPSDAALEGFRLTREKPLAVLIWAVARLISGLVIVAILFGIGGADFTAMTTIANSQAQPDPAKMLPLISHMAPLLTLMIPIGLASYAVLYTAILRAILRPADSRFAYLRLSMDEARQFGLAVIVFALFLLYAFAMEIVSLVLIFAAKALGPAALPVQILVVLALVAAFIYPAVRLSLAPAMTFAEGRISLFRSLPLTKNLFWPLFGAYVLAFVLVVVVWLLASVAFVFVVGAIGMAQGGVGGLPAALGVVQPTEMTLSAFLKPLSLIHTVYGALLTTLLYVLMASPAPAIFRSIVGLVGAPPATTNAEPGKPWG